MTRYASQEAYQSALNNPNSFENFQMGGQGIMGGQDIKQYLNPILQQVRRAYDENEIEPYVQEVQQLTNQTFPDLNLSGGGLRGGLGSLFGQPFGGFAESLNPQPFGFGVQFQGGLDPISQNQRPNTIQSSPNQNPSPFGTSSFFR